MNSKNIIENKYGVLCVCWTYNQSKYIEETLNGFVLQQTRFPYACLVIDDASTDGEQGTIKAWVQRECDMENAEYSEIPESHIVIAKHKSNPNCTFVCYLLTKNLYGNPRKEDFITSWGKKSKYMAFCEGDDFWTTPSKLQEQYEALESHPECTIAFHRTRFIDTEGNDLHATIPWEGHWIDKNIFTLDDYMHEEFYVNRWAFHTSSFFIRSYIYSTFLELRKSVFKHHPHGDQPIQLSALFYGHAYCVQKEMSCYRNNSGGFNTSLAEDQDKNYCVNVKLTKAFKDIDEYTNRKYHKWIRHRAMLFELQVFAYEDRIQWYCFNPEYWTIGVKPGLRTFLKCCLYSLFPKLKKSNKKI